LEAIGLPFGRMHHSSTEIAGSFDERLRALFSLDVALSPEGQRALSAEMTAYRGRNLRFAQLRFSPHSTFNSGSLRRADSRVLVSLHVSGYACVSQGGREVTIEPGQIFVIDPTQAFHIRTGSIETRSVYITRSSLLALIPFLDEVTAIPVRCDTGPAAILRAAIDAMFESGASLNEQAADRIADALPHLLVSALMAVRSRDECATSRLRQFHMQQIRRYVREHLADAELNAARIADGVNLSLRHVYELFSSEPEPLMKWVWAERLDRCRNELTESTLRRRTIGEIAYGWGFSDVSHFSRAFKQKFGVSPRQFRQTGDAAYAC
jgi:AraC-like DNA-binding protein